MSLASFMINLLSPLQPLQTRPKTSEAVSETIDGLVATLSMLNNELRNMLQQADTKGTIKDKRMKRCLSRIRDTMEALAVAEDLRAKLI
jgi:hypothetical protein